MLKFGNYFVSFPDADARNSLRGEVDAVWEDGTAEWLSLEEVDRKVDFVDFMVAYCRPEGDVASNLGYSGYWAWRLHLKLFPLPMLGGLVLLSLFAVGNLYWLLHKTVGFLYQLVS